jgi:hypothetical protein
MAAEICNGDSGTEAEISMGELSRIFPDARVYYTRSAVSRDNAPGVVVYDGAGVAGNIKVIRINGQCPNKDNGACKLGEGCLINKINRSG